MCIVISSHYWCLHASVSAGFAVLRAEQILSNPSVKSVPPVLLPSSQRKRTHQLCLEWRGPVTFLPIDRSNPGGTREGGRGDEQLKKQQTRWPQRETSVDSLLCSPSRLLLFLQSEGDWSATTYSSLWTIHGTVPPPLLLPWFLM